MKFKIIHINNIDTAGSRFNGFNLSVKLLEREIVSYLLVWDKKSESIISKHLMPYFGLNKIARLIRFAEKQLSIQSLLFPFSFFLPFNKYFKEADIVHYHLIHNHFFSLFSLPILTKLKPSVWTLHDPWALTGHCVHPFDCEKWTIQCEDCPFLDTNIPMKKDRTKLMWNIKKFIYKHSNLNLIVASNFMAEMVSKSPLLKNCKLKVIPFGLDLNVFKPFDVENLKKELDISDENIVIAFRASKSKFKGLEYIKNCFSNIKTNKKITLLTFDEKNLLNSLNDKYQIIDMGWIDNDEYLVKLYNIADFFLMPSTQEAFGMMAIEAMACGKPVIVFDKTALPEVINKGNDGCGGIIIPQGNEDLFIRAVKELAENSSLRADLSENAYNISRKYYNEERFIDSLLNYYEEIYLDFKNCKK